MLLLTATWVVALLSVPDPLVWAPPAPARWSDYGFILYRNGLVLALHALACVAGFIAGSSLPVVAEGYRGWWRRAARPRRPRRDGVRRRARRCSRSTTQAYALGLQASHRSPTRNGVSPGAAAGHACCRTRCPSCARCSCRSPPGCSPPGVSAWDELLAATFVTTAIAVPVLMAAAAVEVWVSPHLLYFLK